MSPAGKPAPRDPPGRAVSAFKVIWYASNVAIGLFCLAVFYFLFGLETFMYFLLGLAIAGGLYVAYWLLKGKAVRRRG